MNPLSIAIALTLFTLGIYIGRTTYRNLPQNPKASEPTITTSSTATVTPTAEATTSGTPTNKPTQINIPTSTQAPTRTAPTTSLDSFIYPNATVTNKTSFSMELTSPDNPNAVTSWYENQFKTSGYSTQSVAKTSSNNSIVNKLGGGKNNENVEISITKSSSSQVTTVIVSINSGSDVDIRIQNNN